MPDGLTTTGAAVLGLVGLGARSGYEIQRAAEVSVRFFWALGPPQVYAELKRLEAAGLLEGRDEAQGARARRVHTITPAGRAALDAWVEQPAASPLELRDATLVRLFLSSTPEQARGVVERLRERSTTALASFDTVITPAAQATDAPFPGHVAAYGRELHAFIVGWSERLLAEL